MADSPVETFEFLVARSADTAIARMLQMLHKHGFDEEPYKRMLVHLNRCTG